MSHPFETDPEIGLLEAAVNDDSLYQAQLKRVTVAEDTRPAVENTLSIVNEETVFDSYGWQYARLPDDIKKRCNWHTLCATLLANGGEKLKKVEAMQGGGELFGIDAKGRALFKDKGVEPVMYGYDEKGRLLQIYDRDPEQMAKVIKWANYFESREQVLKDGYELFTLDHNDRFGEEMKQVEAHNTKEPFVASKDRKKRRASWVESGEKPGYARYVRFVPNGGRVRVFEGIPEYMYNDLGVVRLLRV